MCGIFGWVLPSSLAADERLLNSLTGLLHHRGPDGSGSWLAPTRDGQHEIGLGHRRLSIIDFGGGAQPMWSADRGIALIFNGEIYNFVELREELKSKGHVFRTTSDTEVLIEAYRAYGPEAVERFRGMFAFALWDSGRQSLLLARDHFGKKPLFFAEHRGGLIFGSEVHPILAFPGIDRTFDESALGDYLLNRYVPGPRTFFHAIRKLPPGHRAIWAKGQLTLERYFTPPLAEGSSDVEDFDEAVRLFEEVFNDAVRIRMRSDAPFGAFLSGGIDSSAVVAAMARQSSAPVSTFSVGFPQAEYSELSHARVIAEQFQTNHHELVVTPEKLIETWPEAVLRRGAPVSEPSDLPILLLSKEASRSVKMVLTGEGADEVLAGYPKHSAETWMSAYHRLVPGLLHRHLLGPAVRRLPVGLRRMKTLAMAAGERGFDERMRVWFGGVSVAERDALLGEQSRHRSADLFPFSAKQDSALRRTLFFDQTSWLPDNLLERGDRMMMAGSIEGRMPFMDVELARLAARFPDRFLLGHRRGKAVLRAAMRKVIGPEILERKKIGFRVPVAEWFRLEHRDTLLELLRSSGSETRRLCHAPTLDRFIDEHLQSRQNHEKTLWSLANLEMFLRTFTPSAPAYVGDRRPDVGMAQLPLHHDSTS